MWSSWFPPYKKTGETTSPPGKDFPGKGDEKMRPLGLSSGHRICGLLVAIWKFDATAKQQGCQSCLKG